MQALFIEEGSSWTYQHPPLQQPPNMHHLQDWLTTKQKKDSVVAFKGRRPYGNRIKAYTDRQQASSHQLQSVLKIGVTRPRKEGLFFLLSISTCSKALLDWPAHVFHFPICQYQIGIRIFLCSEKKETLVSSTKKAVRNLFVLPCMHEKNKTGGQLPWKMQYDVKGSLQFWKKPLSQLLKEDACLKIFWPDDWNMYLD